MKSPIQEDWLTPKPPKDAAYVQEYFAANLPCSTGNAYADALMYAAERVAEDEGITQQAARLRLNESLPLLHLAAFAGDLPLRGDAAIRVELHYLHGNAKEILDRATRRSPSAVRAYLRP